MPKPKKNVGEDLQTWVVRDVDPQTRMHVRLYATMRGITTAQALKELVDIGMQERKEQLQDWLGRGLSDTEYLEIREILRSARPVTSRGDEEVVPLPPSGRTPDDDEPGE